MTVEGKTIHTSLEERLTLAEKAITELQRQVSTSESINWLQEITGSFKDEPEFEKVLAYGQAVRHGNK
ncbi:hypothetical protein [Synechococcus sp. PCC 6312]|uniref:hypothetical protein n=1 Tax=Synechococcus sp. (strain ATCC 27167 / PCC 6312) TaxID=195253 RepID=UPI00029F3B86|nr:hypothetical protein [Synechococcus sp. PCC 6312]AFY60446.1 hypothetical protein Syn6312_1264 [Synechococcus sp. PCC 6312]